MRTEPLGSSMNLKFASLLSCITTAHCEFDQVDDEYFYPPVTISTSTNYLVDVFFKRKKTLLDKLLMILIYQIIKSYIYSLFNKNLLLSQS